MSLEKSVQEMQDSKEEGTQQEEPECWEELDGLKIDDRVLEGDVCGGDTTLAMGAESCGGLEATSALPGTETDVDKAIQEALQNQRERATVLRLDVEVEKFVRDASRSVLEFGAELTSYQRLLAHRVAQHYLLQTSSVPWGKGLSRVIARKTSESRVPDVRVTDLKDSYLPPEMANPKATPEITIKRRQGAAVGRAPPSQSSGWQQGGSGARTVKQREEEYKAARDRILGNSVESPPEANATRETVSSAGRAALAEDLRNRKAVFKNKQMEMQDPDYKRGTNRYARSMFDPTFNYYEQQRTGIYNVPTYNSEFPALPGGLQGQGVAAPPYYPQNLTGWNMSQSIPPRPHPTGNRPAQNFQNLSPSASGPQSGSNYSMPPYQMAHMGYSYASENPQQQGFHQPSSASAAQFRGMGNQWNPQRMGNYPMHSTPGQESMGMMHPMHGMHQMYGYAPQGPGYPVEYGDMSRMQYSMHAMNGYGDAGQFGSPEAGESQQKPGDQPGLVPKHETSTKPQPVEN